MEDLSPLEETEHGAAAEEIADLVLYYGAGPTFLQADKVEVLQFKHVADAADGHLTASGLTKTIAKFAELERDYQAQHDAQLVRSRLRFTFLSNQDVSPNLAAALHEVRTGALSGDKHAQNQAADLIAASGMDGDAAKAFFSRVSIDAGREDLSTTSRALRHTIVSWSDANDMQARARLGDLKQLVRDKAGGKGRGRNLIRAVDVLPILGVQDEKELFPASDYFLPADPILARVELPEALEAIRSAGCPVLIHADGGVGKTVFIQTVFGQLSARYEAVLFDCFGGGAYRRTADARHRPGVGLLHIMNVLASRGLCDPMLPSVADTRAILRTARLRLVQAVESVRTHTRKDGLAILLDAADNAAMQGLDLNEAAFPKLLLEMLSDDPVPGVRVVASCRTHRRDIAIGKARVHEVVLKAFTVAETRHFLLARRSDATEAQISAAFSRSQGNPRVLAYTIDNWNDVILNRETDAPIPLNTIIAARVSSALEKIEEQMEARSGEKDLLLSALALMPPPVPLDELASALDWSTSAISGFVADLAPLLEHTKLGLIFRDEPTETYIREQFGSNAEHIRQLAARLASRQSSSSYAATALPHLLVLSRDVSTAFDLAFSDQFPSSISSAFGKRRLRFARLRAALTLAAAQEDADRLVGLLMELGCLEAVNSRGDDYIADAPDLVALARDADAMRRLFQDRSGWPGARHSRLAIAHCMVRELDEAAGHIRRMADWTEWFFDQETDDLHPHRPNQPEAAEIAAIPLYLVLKGDHARAVAYLKQWVPVFEFRVAVRMVALARACDHQSGTDHLGKFRAHLIETQTGSTALLAALLEVSAGEKDEEGLLRLLAATCKVAPPFTRELRFQHDEVDFGDALMWCAVKAVQRCSSPVAGAIADAVMARPPSAYSFTSEHEISHLYRYIVSACVHAWSHSRKLRFADLLPHELSGLRGVAAVSSHADLSALIKALPVRKTGRKGKKLQVRTLPSTDEVRNICRVIETALELIKPVESWVLAKKAPTPGDVDSLMKSWRGASEVSLYSEHGRQLRELGESLPRELVWLSIRLLPTPSVKCATAFANELVRHQLVQRFGARTVRVLAIVPSYGAVTGRLAQTIAKAVDSYDHVEQRGQEFADLARAVWPASHSDAREYFRQGLQRLDGIGAGDQSFLSELLAFAAEQRGGFVSEGAGRRLMALCELNFDGDSEKFVWGWFARAAASSLGMPAIGQLIRWNHGDQAPLSYGLPRLVCAFAEKGGLAPERAALLMMLTKDIGWWDWSFGRGLKVLLSAAIPQQRRRIAEMLLEHGRRDHSPGYPRLYAEVREAMAAFPDEFDAKTLADLRASEKAAKLDQDLVSDRSHPPSPSYRTPEAVAARRAEAGKDRARVIRLARSADATSVESVDQQLSKVEALSVAPVNKYDLFFRTLRGRVSFADREKHLEALLTGSLPLLEYRLQAVLACVEDWAPTSAFVRARRPEFAHTLLSHFRGHLFAGDPHLERILYFVRMIGDVTTADLIPDVVKYASEVEEELSSAHWLSLATLMCSRASGDASRAVLERVLNSDLCSLGEAKDAELRAQIPGPTIDSRNVVATLIWDVLGNPDAFERWRAAGILPALAELELADDSDALWRLAATPAANVGASHGDRFPAHNARQWFLIGMARCALSCPAFVARGRGPLTAILASEDDHVIYKLLAARALTAIDGQWPEVQGAPSATVPQAPKGVKRRLDGAPLADSAKDSSFHFEYDFNKYEISEFASMFGMTTQRARHVIAKQVRVWQPGAKSVYELDGPVRRWRREAGDRFEQYGTQLVRHALITVASSLASKRALSVVSYEEEGYDPWPSFVGRYDLTFKDGHWLSDATDATPGLARIYAFPDPHKKNEPPKELADILEAAGLKAESFPKWGAPLGGNWADEEGADIYLTSALVEARGAIGKCHKLSRSEWHDRWLPICEEDGSPRRLGRSDRERDFHAWLWQPQDFAGIDQYDQFAAASACSRLRLGKAISERLGISSADQFGRAWVQGGVEALRSYAWGGKSGSGEDAKDAKHRLLVACPEWLLDFLTSNRLSLAYLTRLSKYVSKYYTPDGDSRVVRTGAVALLSGDGSIRRWAVKPEPRKKRY
ncbi:MAG: hypothetical protein Q8R02_23700 [Hyphomonadaceae bacterium]|nr:hypothetical protein [Hyphomonadaceae bacterium]